MLHHDVPKGYSSIVSEGVINSFNEMFPPARMFPLAVMHPPPPPPPPAHPTSVCHT